MALLLIFAITQGPAPPEVEKKPGDFIGVAAPYVPPASAAPTAPPRLSLGPLPDLPPPPPMVFNQSPPAGGVAAGGQDTVIERPISMTFAVPPPRQAPPAKPAPTEPQHTSVKFEASTIPGIKASPAMDLTLKLMPGLLIVQLDTAIDSSRPGPLMSHIPSAVYSEKSFLLMEAMTKVTGSYESFSQADGVRRLKADAALAWTRNGVLVNFAGNPMADDLGRVGLSGEYDPRYLERFGGAVLLDIAHSGLSIIQAEVAKGGSSYFNFNSSDNLASEILRSSVNLPPLFRKNEGEMIAIWVKYPVSFDDSYRIEATK